MDSSQTPGFSLPLSAYYRELQLGRPYPRPEETEKPPEALPEALREKARADAEVPWYLLVKPYDEALLQEQDRYLWNRNQRAQVVGKDLLPVARTHPNNRLRRKANIALWQGPIAQVKVSGIVKPCCGGLLGCGDPCHGCLDSLIHEAAGVQLRRDCRTLMTLQAAEEPEGDAKITRGYNLPAQYVLHTLSEGNAPAAYRACMDLATRLPHIHSLALPIFASDAEACVHAVDAWMDERRGNFERVVLVAAGADEYAALEEAVRK